MKTLINKANSAIRITAPEILENTYLDGKYGVPYCDFDNESCMMYLDKNLWTLVEEEPEKVNCPFDKGDCRYCTVQFCGAREENNIETRSTAEPKRKQSLALKKIVDNLTEEKLAKTRAEMKLEDAAEPVDLEKEIDKTVSECTNGYNFDWDKFAHHFYELGLNARKEDKQNVWKPTKEMMKALIDCVIGNEYDVHALVRLWGELKKL